MGVVLLLAAAIPSLAHAAKLDEQPYFIFWSHPFGCSLGAAYVVRPRPLEPDGSRIGDVLEVLHGPERATIVLGQWSSRLQEDLIVVYADAEGVVKESNAHHGCTPHSDEHPKTTLLRALKRYHNDPRDVTMLDLLASSELPEVWAGCAEAERHPASDGVTTLLADSLGTGGKLQRQLDRGDQSGFGSAVREKRAKFSDYVAARAYAACVYALGIHIQRTVRAREEDERPWMRKAIGVLLQLSTHPDTEIRRTACRNLAVVGFDVGCSPEDPSKPQRYPDEARRQRWLRALSQ